MVFQQAMTFVTGNFGWLYLFSGLGSIGFALWLAYGSCGRILLGKEGEKPEFSNPSWIAMMFTAGIGAGLVAWGFAEAVFYLQTPPLGIEPYSNEAYEWAHMYPLFHWSFVPWAMYAIPAAPIAYMLFVREVPCLKLSEACITDDSYASWRRVIDILVIIGIIGGAATSLGLGVPLVSAFVAELFGIGDSVTSKLIVLAIWTAMFGTSTYRGLTKGIRILADINMVLAITGIIFVLLAGPTVFILDLTTNSIGLMLSNFFRISLWTSPIDGNSFPETWTVFYWGWWLAYAPMMGLFFGRISRGRTIKQLILGVIGWGTLGTVSFMAIASGYSLHLELSGQFSVTDVLTNSGMSAMVAKIIAQLPASGISLTIFTILSLVFYATSMDSAAYILASICSGNLRSDREPARSNRILWALALAAITAGLVISGGLDTVKSATVISSLALIPIIALMSITMVRWGKSYRVGQP